MPIRSYLEDWQAKFGTPNVDYPNKLENPIYDSEQTVNEVGRITAPNDLKNPRVEESETEELARQRENDGPEDEVDTALFLKKGDLVEIGDSSHAEPTLGVFVRQFHLQTQVYTMHGKWMHVKTNRIQFVIPGFVDPTKIDPIIPHLPQTELTDTSSQELRDSGAMDVPREVGAPLVRALREFAEQTDVEYRKHAGVLETAHRRLAHESDLRFGTLGKIASSLLKNPEPSWQELYAVLVESFNKVADWVRDWQEKRATSVSSQSGKKATSMRATSPSSSTGSVYIDEFAQKARSLIQRNREMRGEPKPGRVGSSKVQRVPTRKEPAMKEIFSVEFSKSDQDIIRFMEAYCVSRIVRGAQWSALGALLLRAIGLYDDMLLDRTTGFLFLQEIGVIVPHENRLKFDPHLLLPTSQHSTQLILMSKALAQLNNEKFQAKDRMRDLRKDWGDLTCFCVDSQGAEEIDDGISLEQIPGSHDHWVHVHVANPTAFLGREHLISKMAAHLTETIYLPEKTYAMLPKWLTQNRLSIAPDRPVLTFSSRLSPDGGVVDIKIQPGLIRNVVSLTPLQLQHVTDKQGALQTAAEKYTILQVGKLPQHMKPELDESISASPMLTDSQMDQLRKLHTLARVRSSKRSAAGGLSYNQQKPDVSVINLLGAPGLPWSHPSRRYARHIEGDPVIRMKAPYSDTWFSAVKAGPDFMVREMMLLAGEVGAKWCRDRNIPIIYRGTIRRPGIMSSEEYEEKYLKPSMAETGYPSMAAGIQYLNTIGSAVASTTPHHHRILGTPQYAKLTSPLRRFGDMIIHWQIEAALRQEAALGRSLQSGDKLDFLPFSKHEIELVVTRLTPRERLITRTKSGGLQHWVAQTLFRAHYYGEYSLPATFEVLVYTIDHGYQVAGCMVKEYSADVIMEFGPELTEGVKIGDTWEARIDSVNPYVRIVKLKPVRLINRERDWN
ncbi:RNB-domain-containing protein [Saccharata proteae CBS 121410]|uniref:RNB-domain-containing protein n=1 Tax=Saccharata proteae CBS 121410 TaxID=1314787 RepID=A0A9P4HYM4_9PEZI|nr:RNB-domain-containing protein [Saccharata proteae CBS 121410]